MKLPITDKFLWLVYDTLEKTEETFRLSDVFKVRTMRDAIPDLGEEFWRKLRLKKERKQFAQFVNYLKRRGYIKIAKLESKKGVLLTPQGKGKALKVKAKLLNKRKRKDKKWIMLIFDVPEKYRKYRDNLREFLYSLGFQQLQKSVWVCPFDVLKELKEILITLRLEKFSRIFLIQEALI